VSNPDGALTPGEFARVRLTLGQPHPALLVPDTAIVPDQSRALVMTVAADGTVVPKSVVTGPVAHGLRVVRQGLDPADRVIIDGIMRASPGAKVTPTDGKIMPDDFADQG
jgi:multidrug efflux system membrane fusion protein